MLSLLLALIICSIFVICSNGNENDRYDFYADSKIKLVDSDKYILDVTQQFIYELEDYGVCNTKLQDMTQNITRLNHFGYDVVGTVYYTKGFLSTFQQVAMKEKPQMARINTVTNSAHMSMDIIFSSLMMFYDYKADLTEKKFSGTVAVPSNNLEIRLYVDKYFDNNTLTHKIEVTATQFEITKVWDYIPSNHYTEVINKDIKLTFNKTLLTTLWNEVLLERAISKIPFPRLCFNC